MCEEESQLYQYRRKIMTQFLQNALGFIVALGTGGLMVAVALV